jgi:hypothetical protein
MTSHQAHCGVTLVFAGYPAANDRPTGQQRHTIMMLTIINLSVPNQAVTSTKARPFDGQANLDWLRPAAASPVGQLLPQQREAIMR